jgi:hypothetical protein
MLDIYSYHNKPETLAGYTRLSEINRDIQELIVSKLDQYKCVWNTRQIYEETQYRIYQNRIDRIGYISFDVGEIGKLYILTAEYIDCRDKIFQSLKFNFAKIEDVETVNARVSDALDKFLVHLQQSGN